MSDEKRMMVQSNSSVAELNYVPGFDPVKLLQKSMAGKRGEEPQRTQLLLKYKKLWFRLACPRGRIRLTALRMTEQMAIIQAEVFRDKDDPNPVSNYIASRTVHNATDGLYIQAAQYEAIDNALTDAGFGIQLCDTCKAMGEEAYTSGNSESALPEGVSQPKARELRTDTAAAPGAANTPPAETLHPDGGHLSAQKALPIMQSPEALPQREAEAPASRPEAGEVQMGEDQRALDSMTRLEQGNEPQHAGRQPESTAQVIRTAPQAAPMRDASPSAVSNPTNGGTATQERADDLPPASQAHGTDTTVDREPQIGEMTLEEARNMVADVGSCRGKTLAQIADRRPTTLRWYFTSCPDSSERLRQAARMVFESLNQQKTA